MEREVSLKSGKAALDAMRRKGLNVLAIDVDRRVAQTLADRKIGLAFIALHGAYGEDGSIQGLLECAGIPYTGAGVLGSALAFNKVVSKKLFNRHGIPTPDFQVLYKGQAATASRTLELPVVVKPSDQGSSIGITIVRQESEWRAALEQAFACSDEVIVEKFIEGKLLAVGMNGERPFPIVHIIPKSGFYDYEAKYTPGKTEYVCPADLDEDAAERCREIAVTVFRALKGRGTPRVDFILDPAGAPYVLEMNTIPGMTSTSLLPMAAKQAGMEFDDLVLEMLDKAQLDYQG